MIVHATTVAVDGAGLMISGASGTGKSSLALGMLTRGACLVSDDRTVISRPDDGPPWADAPNSIRGLIESRGLGLISVDAVGPARLAGVVDMSLVEHDRLPPARHSEILGFALPLLHRIDSTAFPDALVLWLRAMART